MDEKELLRLRAYALKAHMPWKLRSRNTDLITQGRWSVVWPDLTWTEEGALVEDVYTEALYDKAATAASVSPIIEVAPRRGTTEDRAETSAQKRRRVFVTLLQTMLDDHVSWVMDWLQHGVMVGMPWKDFAATGMHPFGVRIDPRWYYPLSHNSQGELTQGFFLRYRPLHEVIHDYGYDTEWLRGLEGWRARRNQPESPEVVEEIFYADPDNWGIGMVATAEKVPDAYRYTDPAQYPLSGDPFVHWVVPPHPHNLAGCPLVETRRRTADGEYRGALDPMVPNLKIAQRLMARMLESVDFQTAMPMVTDNIENPAEIRPGGILRGTGEGPATLQIPTLPFNAEAMSHKNQAIEAARAVGHYPQQRSGEPGASISSGKGTSAVMGGFNTELAWSQRDSAVHFRRMLTRLANFDQVWCPGNKRIEGWDEGEMYSETYDPATFWKDDWRCEITFHRVGLDEHNYLTRLALVHNLGGMSTRSLIRKAGFTDNYLNEERDRDIESAAKAFFALLLQQAEAGNGDPLRIYTQKIDSDKKTSRQAMFETIQEAGLVSGAGNGQPGPQRDPLNAAIGGVAGLEAGGTTPGLGALRSLMPAGAPRALEEAR